MYNYILAFSTIFLFASCNSGSNETPKKCISCHFFLTEKDKNVFSILREDMSSKKFITVIDSVDGLNWKSCNLFVNKGDMYVLIQAIGDKIEKRAFQSIREMNDYCKENDLISDFTISSARDVYAILLERACE